MELPDFILDVAKSNISDADLGALLRGALGLTEAPKHLQLGALMLGSAMKQDEDKKQRNREYMREYMRKKRQEKGGRVRGDIVTPSTAEKPKKRTQKPSALPPSQHPPPPEPPKPQPQPEEQRVKFYYSSGQVSNAANSVAYRKTTPEQRAFIKAFCKRPKDYVAFNEAYAEAVHEVKPDVLEECARLAVEYQRKTDGDSQKLRRPETWLADRAWLDFVAQAKSNVKERNALNNVQTSLDFLDNINPNTIGVFDDDEE